MSSMTLYINSGICKCGCPWDDHHLGVIVNSAAYKALPEGYPPYIPQECERFGFNEDGGKKYNKETGKIEDHCHQYEDKDGPLGKVEY